MRIPLFSLRSNEYRHLKVLISELSDDVEKLTELYGRIDARQRSGLRKQQRESAPDITGGDGGGDVSRAEAPIARLAVGDGSDRTAVRQALHERAKQRGLR